MPEHFISSSELRLTLDHVVQEIIRFMQDGPNHRYKITIGTDSERLADNGADFVTAVVVHRIGNGGRYFWRRAQIGKFHTLRDRIIKEVLLSLELGKLALLALKERSHQTFASGAMPQWEFEIHADIGENGPTKAVLQEVVGMIRAHDFAAITKPGSYAASNVADRHV